MDFAVDMFELLIPLTAIVATFLFLGVILWSRQRRREREAFYRHEMIKQMVNKGVSEENLLGLMDKEMEKQAQNRRQGLMLGGLITLAVGIGFLIGFRFVDEGVAGIGWIPVMVGVAMLVGSFLITMRGDKSAAG